MRRAREAGASGTSRHPPFVGRSDELDFVLDTLAESGCVIAGAAGVGKSHLAAEAVTRSGLPALRAKATASAATIPFGALAHLLDSPMGSIVGHVDAIRRHSTNGPPVLLVDDVHLLDSASAALLLAVHEAAAARLLLTLRDAEAVTDGVTALWKDCGLERIDLSPLARHDVRSLVTGFLEGEIEEAAEAWIWSLSAGNPLYALELTRDARAGGALVEHDGRWGLTGRQPELRRLRELIGDRTARLSAGAREAVEVLSVSAPIELDALVEVVGGEAVEELERAQLATVRPSASGGGTVDLGHPLFGDVLRGVVPSSTLLRHRRRLVEVLRRRGPSGPHELIRLAALQLEAGDPDPELLLAAATAVMRLQAGVPGSGWGDGDAMFAIRLADAAGPGLQAVLVGCQARMALSRHQEIESRLAPLEETAAVAPREVAAAYLRARAYALQWSGIGATEAIALLERAGRWHEDADWQALLATLRAWLLVDQGRYLPALHALEPVVDAAGVAPQRRLDLLVALIGVRRGLGRVADGLALEPEILRLAQTLEDGSWQTGWARHAVDGLIRVDGGVDLGGAQRRLEASMAAAERRGDAGLAAALGMVLGRLELNRGHAAAAVTLLENCVSGLSAGDPRNALPTTLAFLSRARALLGDAEGAEAACRRAREVSGERPDTPRNRLEILRAAAWCEVARGRHPSGRRMLDETLDLDGDGVRPLAEAVYDLLRLGAHPARCARRLAAFADACDNQVIRMWAEHARAVAHRDGEAALEAAKRFAELGLDLHAAEASAGAAKFFQQDDRADQARAAYALASRCAAACGDVHTPWLDIAGTGSPLTPREEEVALLAARGLANAEIAHELVISVRTAETYVLRVCKKLGVGRSELRHFLGPRAASREVA